jgi:VanZ family protein
MTILGGKSDPSGSSFQYLFVFMKRLFRVLAWVLVFGIVALSIVPPDYRVITDFPRSLEHLSIFLLAGVAFGLGYPDRYPLQTIALALFAAGVELVQVGVPGRHARFSDFAAGVLGFCLGIGLAYVSTRMVEWRDRKGRLCSNDGSGRPETQVR